MSTKFDSTLIDRGFDDYETEVNEEVSRILAQQIDQNRAVLLAEQRLVNMLLGRKTWR